MEIKARRWLAVWYQCPNCGAQSGSPQLTPTQRHREQIPKCHNYRCDDCNMLIVERRYYTTFAIEAGVSQTMVAGTLERLGPFTICTIVHPTIRAFRRWVEQRRAELAEQHRLYMEVWRRREEEGAARRKHEAQERALLREAEAIAYQREHAVELAAEQVARAVWPEEEMCLKADFDESLFDDDHPF